MEKASECQASTTDTSRQGAPQYTAAPPGYHAAPPYAAAPPYPAAPLPDGYYAAGAPPPYPAGAVQVYQPPPGYPTPQGQVCYAGQPPVIIQQQPNVMVVGQYAGQLPPDYQALAWFACLCCFWPVGIAAIIKSNEVRNAWARGDYASASIASSSARTLSMVSIGLGIALLVLWIVILVIWLIPLLVFGYH